MLARLVRDVGRPVGVDTLASALWNERPPPTAAKALQVHVMRVRSFLEPGRPASTSRFLVRQGPGYSLTLTATDIDAGELAVRCARGRALLEQVARVEGDLQWLQTNVEIESLDEGQEQALAVVLSRLDEHDRAEIAAIDRALARIRRGKYDICEACGESIPEARLQVLPAAERCLPCAEVAERSAGRASG